MVTGIFTIEVAEGPTCGGCRWIGVIRPPNESARLGCMLLDKRLHRALKPDGSEELAGPAMKCDECLSAIADLPVFNVWASGKEEERPVAIEKHCGNCIENYRDKGCIFNCTRDGSSSSLDRWEEAK